MRNKDLVIVLISIMDFVTALIVLFNPPLVVARLGIFYDVFSKTLGGAFLLISALLAIVAVFKLPHSSVRYFLLLPQQFFLLLTSSSSILFVILGHYADGVTRPWIFIFQDQLPSLILVLLYSFTIFDIDKSK